MIEIVGPTDEPVHVVRYLNAARGGGTQVERLIIALRRVTGLPAGLQALVATSDLQGVCADPRTGETRLLGVTIAETLEELAFEGTLPPAATTGILLAGDLFCVPDKRGGFGDVSAVWRAFAERFSWVAGVAGNHDDVSAIEPAAHVHLLDSTQVTVDGLRIGGVGLIAGNPAKRGRRSAEEQLDRIARMAAEELDLLLLHEGPRGESSDQRGNAAIRALVEEQAVPLTVCGHDHWEPCVSRHRGGTILNVEARVIVLLR